jgi:DNA (cytosine-5)-methyltransferase 1
MVERVSGVTLADQNPDKRRPRLLDLFCGAGGAAMGYHRAGFDVVGVDIRPQPNYPFAFWQADALDVLGEWADDGEPVEVGEACHEQVSDFVGGAGVGVGGFDVQVDEDLAGHVAPLLGAAHSPKPAFRVKDFDAIHASPPCQVHSALAWHPQNRAAEHPDLIPQTRGLLQATGLPYVIENVVGAPLTDPVTICGASLGLDVKRHRLFETSFMAMAPPCGCGGWRPKQFEVWRHGHVIRTSSVPVYGTGGGKAAEHWPVAMGIDWMTRAELSQAIPPAYTELIGHQLLAQVKAAAWA